MIKSFIVSLLFIIPLSVHSQIDTMALKTVKGITDKMLELISVDIGEEPNWDEYRNLFLATATKTSIRTSGPPNKQVRTFNIEQFIRSVGPLYSRDGFLEYSIGLEVLEYNGIATAFQSYYSKNLKGSYESRGINCYQLVFADDRWWIANTSFTAEDPEQIIPKKYLFQKN